MEWKYFTIEKEVIIDVECNDVKIEKEFEVQVGLECRECGGDLTCTSSVDNDGDIVMRVDKHVCDE